MNYWLLKTEPGTFSWDDLIKQGNSMWDGVRNYQARNNLRQMKTGDIVLFYHSGENPCIVGLAEVSREHYPDPTATSGDWSVVDIKPVKKFKRSIPLGEIKQTEKLRNMSLVRSFRLSVQPVKPEEFEIIMKKEVT
jgi:predicted RNA-binding protein with PUA-like domain